MHGESHTALEVTRLEVAGKWGGAMKERESLEKQNPWKVWWERCSDPRLSFIGSPESPQSHKLGVPEISLGWEVEDPLRADTHAPFAYSNLSLQGRNPITHGCRLQTHSQGTCLLGA